MCSATLQALTRKMSKTAYERKGKRGAGGMTPQEAIILVEECGLNIEGIVSAECEKVVLNALEKQIPKKPLDIEGDYTALYGNCPNCKNTVCDNEAYKYCNDCGQALDWSDTE